MSAPIQGGRRAHLRTLSAISFAVIALESTSSLRAVFAQAVFPSRGPSVDLHLAAGQTSYGPGTLITLTLTFTNHTDHPISVVPSDHYIRRATVRKDGRLIRAKKVVLLAEGDREPEPSPVAIQPGGSTGFDVLLIPISDQPTDTVEARAVVKDRSGLVTLRRYELAGSGHYSVDLTYQFDGGDIPGTAGPLHQRLRSAPTDFTVE